MKYCLIILAIAYVGYVGIVFDIQPHMSWFKKKKNPDSDFMCFSCTASAPVFVSNPIRVIATLGKDVSLECKPRASPKPRITWRRGDRKIQPSKRYTYLGFALISNEPVYIRDAWCWLCQNAEGKLPCHVPLMGIWKLITAQGHCFSTDVWSCKG